MTSSRDRSLIPDNHEMSINNNQHLSILQESDKDKLIILTQEVARLREFMLTTKSFIDIGKLNLVDSIRNVTFDGKNNLFDQILDIKSIPDIFSLSIRFVQLIQSQSEIILKLEKSLETKCKDSLENKEVPSTLNTSARKDLGTFTRIPSVLIRDSPISNIAITDVYRETTSSSSTPSIKHPEKNTIVNPSLGNASISADSSINTTRNIRTSSETTGDDYVPSLASLANNYQTHRINFGPNTRDLSNQKLLPSNLPFHKPQKSISGNEMNLNQHQKPIVPSRQQPQHQNHQKPIVPTHQQPQHQSHQKVSVSTHQQPQHQSFQKPIVPTHQQLQSHQSHQIPFVTSNQQRHNQITPIHQKLIASTHQQQQSRYTPFFQPIVPTYQKLQNQCTPVFPTHQDFVNLNDLNSKLSLMQRNYQVSMKEQSSRLKNPLNPNLDSCITNQSQSNNPVPSIKQATLNKTDVTQTKFNSLNRNKSSTQASIAIKAPPVSQQTQSKSQNIGSEHLETLSATRPIIDPINSLDLASPNEPLAPKTTEVVTKMNESTGKSEVIKQKDTHEVFNVISKNSNQKKEVVLNLDALSGKRMTSLNDKSNSIHKKDDEIVILSPGLMDGDFEKESSNVTNFYLGLFDNVFKDVFVTPNTSDSTQVLEKSNTLVLNNHDDLLPKTNTSNIEVLNANQNKVDSIGSVSPKADTKVIHIEDNDRMIDEPTGFENNETLSITTPVLQRKKCPQILVQSSTTPTSTQDTGQVLIGKVETAQLDTSLHLEMEIINNNSSSPNQNTLPKQTPINKFRQQTMELQELQTNTESKLRESNLLDKSDSLVLLSKVIKHYWPGSLSNLKKTKKDRFLGACKQFLLEKISPLLYSSLNIDQQTIISLMLPNSLSDELYEWMLDKIDDGLMDDNPVKQIQVEKRKKVVNYGESPEKERVKKSKVDDTTIPFDIQKITSSMHRMTNNVVLDTYLSYPEGYKWNFIRFTQFIQNIIPNFGTFDDITKKGIKRCLRKSLCKLIGEDRFETWKDPNNSSRTYSIPGELQEVLNPVCANLLKAEFRELDTGMLVD